MTTRYASITIPNAPAIGDVWTPGGGSVSYRWDGTKWVKQPITLPTNSSGVLRNDGNGNLVWDQAVVGLPTNAAGVLKNDGNGVLSWVAQAAGSSLPANAAGVLKNDGAGVLSWAALPGAGAYTLLASKNMAGVISYTVTGLDLTGYKFLYLATKCNTGANQVVNKWNGIACGLNNGTSGVDWSTILWNDLSIGTTLVFNTYAGAFSSLSVAGYTNSATSVTFEGGGQGQGSGTLYLYGVK
jgi:hypothetical protein